MEYFSAFSNLRLSTIGSKPFHSLLRKRIRLHGFLLILLLFSFSPVYSQTLIQGVEEQDYNALVDIYNSTGGDTWTTNTGWLDPNVLVNDWYGVTVTNNRVTALQLNGNNLAGSLPVSIGNLTGLVSLSIQKNGNLKGTLPDVFHNLSQLQRLYLNNNNLSGSLPPSLGNCTNLQYVHLHVNNFSESIPEGYGNLKNVYQLYISYNGLTGTIPDNLMTLNKVMYFYLNNNSLTGSIPVNVNGLSNARTILLNNNQISGAIPASVGNMTSLQQLNLENNQLTGSIPESLGGLSNATSIRLSNNLLSGEVPATLGYLPKLQKLHLFTNKLSGTLPSTLGNITSLQSFSVESNQLSGSVPEEMASLPNLQVFDISNNQFTGLPSTAFVSTAITELDVSNNHLTFDDLLPHKDQATINMASTVPVSNDTLVNLSGGNYTIEGVDKLSDTYYKWYRNDTLVNEGYTPEYTIKSITVADTGFYRYEFTNTGFPNITPRSGQTHLQIGNLDDSTEYAALKALYESTKGGTWTTNTNWLNGTTSADFATWHGVTVENGNVTRIDLPKNNLQGDLPEELGNLKALHYLSLYNNGISSLPESIGNLINLDTLYVFFTQLTRVPEGIGKLTSLQTLRLHANQLKSLPAGIGNLKKIESLSVHENQLTSLPESIGKLKKLNILYAYGNNLTSIPESVGTLPELGYIYLRYNKLNSLPVSLKDLSNLVHLDVRNNHLPFEAIEQFFSGVNTKSLSGNFYFSPHDIKTPIEIATLVGQREVLNARDNAPHNSYQWQKKADVLWTNMEGDTVSTYETALAEGEAEAFYRCLITNEWITADTLYSPEYHLKVSQSTVVSLAENAPDDLSTAPSVSGTVNKPADITTTPSVNYVRTFTPRIEITDPSLISMSSLVDEVNVVTKYIDGLGRAVQTVAKEASKDTNDVILPIVYDEYGRQLKEYLPYAYGSTSAGSFQANALSQQYNFYHASGDNIADTDYPFAESVFEPSPMNRLTAKAAPGESWRKGSGKEVEFSWRPNSTALDGEIRIWKVNDSDQIPYTNAIYQDGELWVNETTDERDKKVWEYKDKQGQVVLKKVQLADVPVASNVYDYLYTYYIYDDLQRLRFVIQPEGLKRIASASWAVSESIRNEFCFSYRYDGKGRMIIKQVPGAEPVYMVYNKRDLLVLSQDGKQRKEGEWSFTKYDGLNRPIATGVLMGRTNSKHDGYHQAAWDDYVVVETTAKNEIGYTNNAFPVLIATAGDYYLSLSYYDDYDFNSDDIGDAAYKAAGLTPEPVSHPYNRGLLTASKTKVIDVDKWLWTYTFYDDRGRVIQVQSVNQLGGQDILTTQYRNAVNNEVLTTKLQHTATGKPGVDVVKGFEYDHTGRLLQVKHKVNNAVEDVVLLANDYNELGELIKKNLHKGAGDADYHQKVDYAYNIRGWLTKINDAEAASSDDLFSMNLYYDYGFTNNSFNGNISGVKWKNPLSDDIKVYGYSYDNLNRVTGADYVAGTAGSWTKEKDRYDIGGIQYDYNGNISDLSRNGLLKDDIEAQSKTYSKLDVLSYSYSSGNKLSAVSDAGSRAEGFKDGDVLTEEYLYDENGNLREDKNKKISLIKYNLFNLPQKVTFTSGDYIEYDYDGAGRKLSSRVYKAGVLEKQQDYVGELHYVDGALDFIHHPEGRVVVKGTELEYQYFLKDHLGNTRLSFTTKPGVEEYIATYETDKQEEEAATFQQYNQQDILSYADFNHTPVAGASRVLRLNNSRGDYQGTAKNIAVLPGDTVVAEVYVKYLDLRRSSGLNADMIIAALAGAAGYTVGTDAVGTTTITQDGTTNIAYLGGPDADAAPTAFLNYYLTDRDRTPYDMGYAQVGASAAITSPDNLGGGHAVVQIKVPVTKAGYIHVEFTHDPDANGATQDVDIYFDDFTVQHKHGPIIQAEDYYPFGLTFNSYVSGDKNKYLYNGKELQEDLGLDMYDYGARFYDPAVGRFFTQDRFAEKYYDFTPYQYAANNPVLYIDVNGDSIYISHRKETIVYHEGQLYNKDGSTYNGKAYNKKGKLKGYVKHAKNALDDIRTGGDAGKELIDYFQNSDYKDIQIQKGSSNGEASGLITWNPTDRKSNIPNADGSHGRDPFIGLAHEIGHSWDRWENGNINTNKVWYTAADGTKIRESEKIATWWENRIRAENGVGLRSHYSFINNNGNMQGEPAGRLIIPGTRLSEHNNIFGKQRSIQPGQFGIITYIPYKY